MFMLRHYSWHPNVDLRPEMTLKWSLMESGDLPAYTGLMYDYLESYSAIGRLTKAGPICVIIFLHSGLMESSIVFQFYI